MSVLFFFGGGGGGGGGGDTGGAPGGGTARDGSDVAPTNLTGCECEFEYQYRWPQFYEHLLSGDRDLSGNAIALLAERDRSLEDHFFHRCCNGSAACLFEYLTHWPQIGPGLLSGDSAQIGDAVAVLEENDRLLEKHLHDRPCFGTNYVLGITCEFDYPTRWSELYAGLLGHDIDRRRATIALLDERDRALELHLKLRQCHPSGS